MGKNNDCSLRNNNVITMFRMQLTVVVIIITFRVQVINKMTIFYRALSLLLITFARIYYKFIDLQLQRNYKQYFQLKLSC